MNEKTCIHCDHYLTCNAALEYLSPNNPECKWIPSRFKESAFNIITINHYGKWVSSDKPITGVIGINELGQAFFDELNYSSIDITLEEYLEDNPDDLTQDELDNLDFWDSSQDAYRRLD